METFTAIFTQLGVDSSLLPQFFIVVGIFLLAQFLFLGKLQEVIEIREEKTIKTESSAEETLEKVAVMQKNYKAKIDEANRAALKNSTEKKSHIAQASTEKFKQVEKEVNQYVDQSRVEFGKEVEGSKDTYLAEAETLAQSLVQKILQ